MSADGIFVTRYRVTASAHGALLVGRVRPRRRSKTTMIIIVLLNSPKHLPITIRVDGKGMVTVSDNVHELRPKSADSEKITINVGYVDLGQIDLLVREGFYSNRTDLIRTAIRNQIDRHSDAVQQSVVRKTLDLGLRHYSRTDLEAARARGEVLRINVLGLATIASDVTPELARAAIASVTVLGALHATAAVKAALADRMG